jgi:type VI secretion system protein VasD
MSNRIVLCAVASASVLLLSACGAWQAASDSTSAAYHAVFFKQVKVLNVDLSARAALNPDVSQRPCSVAVRVYQLKERKGFDAASYDDLLKNDRTVLAQDLQDTMAVVVNPGASASLSQPMKADTQYVAVVAFYQNPDKDGNWRRVIAKKKLDAKRPLKLELADNFILDAGKSKDNE